MFLNLGATASERFSKCATKKSQQPVSQSAASQQPGIQPAASRPASQSASHPSFLKQTGVTQFAE